LGAPREPAVAELRAAEDRLRTLTAGAGGPRVLALSAAGQETAYLARPLTWPDLRFLSELGVRLIEPAEGPGANWYTAEWSEAATLAPDILLADVRANAAPREQFQDNEHVRAIAEHAQILPWNPEAPSSHHAHARFLGTIADAIENK
jgi:iron complex transport system substrate-binding protein